MHGHQIVSCGDRFGLSIGKQEILYSELYVVVHGGSWEIGDIQSY